MAHAGNASDLSVRANKRALFRRVFWPSYFDYSAGFVLAITDSIFLAMVDGALLNALALAVTFMIIAYATCQIIANVSSSEILSKAMAQDSERGIAHNRVVLSVMAAGAIYTLAIYLVSPTLIRYATPQTEWLDTTITIAQVLSLNAACVALRKATTALLTVHAAGVINLCGTLIVITTNLTLNFAAYLVIFPTDPRTFAIAVPTITLVSQGMVGIGLLYLLAKQGRFSGDLPATFTPVSLVRVLFNLKVGFVSSVETASYVAFSYAFLAALGKIDTDLLVTRNFIAPWFQMVGALSLAWSVWANRELAASASSQLSTDLFRSARKMACHATLTAAAGATILFVILFSIVLPLSPVRLSLTNVLVTFIILSSVELLRASNMIFMTSLRLAGRVKWVALGALCSQGVIVGLLYGLTMENSQTHMVALLPIAVFGLVMLDEAVRTLINFYTNRRLHRPLAPQKAA